MLNAIFTIVVLAAFVCIAVAGFLAWTPLGWLVVSVELFAVGCCMCFVMKDKKIAQAKEAQ